MYVEEYLIKYKDGPHLMQLVERIDLHQQPRVY